MASDASHPDAQAQALDDAIEHLYDVFRKYRFTDLEGAPCFPGWCDPKPLLAQPLRQLEAEAFETFAYKAVTTWGNQNDFKHFLPRMLELTILEGSSFALSLERWLVFSKIEYAQWRSWPALEQEAIEELVARAFEWTLSRPAFLVADPNSLEETFTNLVNTTDESTFKEYAISFLDDLSRLDATLQRNMQTFWDQQITQTKGTAAGPLVALALAYLDLNMSEPRLPKTWYQSQHIQLLADAWADQSEHPILSKLYSDAHATAERHMASLA